MIIARTRTKARIFQNTTAATTWIEQEIDFDTQRIDTPEFIDYFDDSGLIAEIRRFVPRHWLRRTGAIPAAVQEELRRATLPL